MANHEHGIKVCIVRNMAPLLRVYLLASQTGSVSAVVVPGATVCRLTVSVSVL